MNLSVVTVAQLVEPRLVVPVVAGSSPVGHPTPSIFPNNDEPPENGCRNLKKEPGRIDPASLTGRYIDKILIESYYHNTQLHRHGL